MCRRTYIAEDTEAQGVALERAINNVVGRKVIDIMLCGRGTSAIVTLPLSKARVKSSDLVMVQNVLVVFLISRGIA